MMVPSGSWYQTPTKTMVVRKSTYKTWWLDFQGSSKHWNERIAHEIDVIPKGKSYLSTLNFWVPWFQISPTGGPPGRYPRFFINSFCFGIFCRSLEYFFFVVCGQHRWYFAMGSKLPLFHLFLGDGRQLNSRGFISTQWAEFSMHGGWRLRSWPTEGKLQRISVTL